MRRIVFLMLAVFIVSISMYGDIGKGDWTQGEINYFSNREYKGNCTMYSFLRKWIPPYVLPDLTEGRFIGYGGNVQSRISKLILIGKLDKNTEFRYLNLLRNEIYARNGYIFRDARLKAFFNQMPWYKPISEDAQLNGYERWNIKQIESLEGKVRAIVELKEINPDTFPEKYTGKIVIDAKWGKGFGEFGYFKHGFGRGPNAFTVGNDGNIYILDHNNGNIKKYNKDGKLMEEYSNMDYHSSDDIAVDLNGNIYVSTGYSGIIKYDQKRDKIESAYQKVDITSSSIIVRRDRILVLDGNKVVLDTKEFNRRGERPLSQVNIDNMEVEKGGVVRISNAVDKSREVSINIPKIFNKQCEPIGIGKDDYTFRLTYFGRDKERNIYISCEYDIIKGIGETEDKEIEVLYKYNKIGKLVAVIKDPALKEVFAGMGRFSNTRVDIDGNVYFFRPDENGLKIYKYEMR